MCVSDTRGSPRHSNGRDLWRRAPPKTVWSVENFSQVIKCHVELIENLSIMYIHTCDNEVCVSVYLCVCVCVSCSSDWSNAVVHGHGGREHVTTTVSHARLPQVSDFSAVACECVCMFYQWWFPVIVCVFECVYMCVYDFCCINGSSPSLCVCVCVLGMWQPTRRCLQ